MDTNEIEIINANRKSKKRSNIFVLVTLIVVLVAALTVFLFKTINNSGRDFVYAVYNSESKSSLIYLDGKLIDTVEGLAEVYENMDGSGCYVQSTYESYYINDDKLVAVKDGLQVCKLANHANVALAKDSNSQLYLLIDNEPRKITDECVSDVAISGNGKIYAYNMGKDAYFGEKPGKETKVENVSIEYISEDGRLIYGFVYGTNKLVLVDEKGDVDEVMDEVERILGLNSRGTELMFVADNKTYILEDGENCVEIINKVLYEDYIYCKENDEVSSDRYRNVDSYKRSVFLMADSVYLISGNYKSLNIVSGCYSILDFSGDLSKMLYLKNYKGLYTLCMIDVKVGATEIEIEKEADNGVISLDGKEIYYFYYDMEARQTCLRYVEGNKEPETIFWVPVGNNVSKEHLEKVGDSIYAHMDDIYYMKSKHVVLVESLAEDIEFVVDESKKEEYVVFDYKLYKLDKTKLTDADNNIVDKLEKKKLTTEEKIQNVESIFKVDLPENIEIKYESSGGDNLVARVEIDEATYQNIVEQYEGIQLDMMKYTGIEGNELGCMPISYTYYISEIKHWYQIDSKYDEEKPLSEADMDIYLIMEIKEATNVFICSKTDGEYVVVFGRNYASTVTY